MISPPVSALPRGNVSPFTTRSVLNAFRYSSYGIIESPSASSSVPRSADRHLFTVAGLYRSMRVARIPAAWGYRILVQGRFSAVHRPLETIPAIVSNACRIVRLPDVDGSRRR